MMYLAAAGVLLSFALSIIADDLTIQTTEGMVAGTQLSSTVRRWLGIRYAASTAGTGRWAPPQPPPTIPQGTVFNATSFGDSCPQNLNLVNAAFLKLAVINGNVPQSEDCLSLNIWAPPTSRPQNTAVLIWIFGGSLEFGTSDTSYYDGEAFVRDNDDITLVTINYRTNIFSAPTAPQITGVGNFGLSDIEAAINWVFNNIAGFGGDPDRITLFGESAGGIAADAYAFSHPRDTIIKGIISESGVTTLGPASLIPASNPSAPNSQWNVVANAVGCGTGNNAGQLTCMKGIPFDTLENAVIAHNLQFTFVPDGVTFFNDYATRGASGQFLKVPFLVGNNADEGDIFAIIAEEETFNFTVPITTETLSEETTLGLFSCPASTAALDRVTFGVPTFRYRYEGVFPDISSCSDLRAFHLSEVPIVFGTYNKSAIAAAPTSTEIKLSKYVQSAWVAFARNPSTGLRGSAFRWPLYDPNPFSVIPSVAILGGSANPTGMSLALPLEFDEPCAFTETDLQLITEIATFFNFF